MTKWKVGITGGIGSGKSYCAWIFNRLGIAVYYADLRAHYIMHTDPDVIDSLTALLGKKAYDDFGMLQKDYFRSQVFGNTEMRERINAIVHPAVQRDYEEWHADQEGAYTLKEAALLVESGSYRKLDYLIMVSAPMPYRVQRIMARDGITAADVHRRISSQLPDEAKKVVSDLFINNSGCYSLMEQILEIHRTLTKPPSLSS